MKETSYKVLDKDLVLRIKRLVADYIEGANEAEDTPLKKIEISRLNDFVLYCENTEEVI